MRLCRLCRRALPATDQYFGRAGAYLRRVCRSCHRAQVKAWRERVGEDPKKKRARRLRREYGITDGEYVRMLTAQGGACQICGLHPSGEGPNAVLNIDHDHITGRVRGLLCNACNTALGKFGDDPARLRRAAEYLEGTLTYSASCGTV